MYNIEARIWTLVFLFLLIFASSGWSKEGWNRTTVLKGRIYLTSDSGVKVLDGSTMQLIADIPIDRLVKDIAFSPDGNRAYVALGGGESLYQTTGVAVIDLLQNRIIDSFDFGEGFHRMEVTVPALELSPDGKRLYVVIIRRKMESMGWVEGMPVLEVYDLATKKRVKSILLVDLPVRDKMDPLIRSVSSLHLDRQGSKLFLFDASALSFLVVDIVEVERATDLISAAKAGKIFKRVTLMDDPTVKKTGTYQTIDLTPQVITSTANKLYLPLQTKHGRLRVAIIDTEQATVQTFEADTTLYGQGGAVKEDDRRLYLVSGHLMVIDLENKRMIQEIHLGSRWYRSMAISDNGKHLYLFDIDNLTLAVIEMETYEVISEVLISR